MKVDEGRPTSLRQALLIPCLQQLYGDGEPHWRVGRNNRPAPTAAEAQNKHRNLVNLLKRTSKFGDAPRELAERLAGCSKRQRCLSGACPMCSRAAQRLIVHASEDIFGLPDKWAWTTCVSHLDRVPLQHLADSSHLLIAEQRLLQAIATYNIRTFGMLDIDVVEHQLHAFPAYYQLHFHGLFSASHLERRELLRTCFPKTREIPRPVRVDGYDGRRRARGYMGRWLEKRRISLAPKILRDRKNQRNGLRQKQILSNERVELALALDRAGLDARLIMFGYEFVSDSRDVWLAPVSRDRARQLQHDRETDIHKRHQERLRQQRIAAYEENRRLNSITLYRRRKRGLFAS